MVAGKGSRPDQAGIPADPVDLPRWGSAGRDKKALVILRVLRRHGPSDLSRTHWLDIGCGSGGIAESIADEVQTVTAVDPEPWPMWREYGQSHANLRFIAESVDDLSIPGGTIDVVICNQVYEHVDNPRLLIAQIHRVLKPGGFCYFAGPNLLFPIEPHVFWPFIHWIPRARAVWLMKLLRAKNIVDAYSTTYWTLREWLGAFEISDVVVDIVRDPDYYSRRGVLWAALSRVPAAVLRRFVWMSPGFVFVLRKPLEAKTSLGESTAV